LTLATLTYPQIDPVALRLGPLSVHWYGLAYVAGFVAAALVLRALARRWSLGLTDDDVLNVLLGAVIGVVVGGRLGYVLLYGSGHYLDNPASVLALWDGGMSFHGGLAGILIAGVIVARTLGISWLALCDLGAVGAPIGIGLGRLANFINGELWGRVTDAPWGMVFPGGGPLPRHPSQLYEALLEGLLLFVVLAWLAWRTPPRPQGELLGWLLIGYGAARISVEFFREPDIQLGFLAGGWLTMGMVLSLPMLLCGVWLVTWARHRNISQTGSRALR
jgi:phosphatidylglycerol:prolipoprotein diacylglycerol transferase